MDPNRKQWNEGHKKLRKALDSADGHQKAIDLFLRQHAMVHRAEMSQMRLPSFADEVWEDTDEIIVRCVPPKLEHSIAWIIWHLARIEDMTMNGLLGDVPQVFFLDEWHKKLNISLKHSGNVVMDEADVTELSQTIDIQALKAYRLAVGRSTQKAVRGLQPGDFKQKVKSDRLQMLLENGSVLEEARGLLDYWGNLTIAGLMLMPPTRHNLVHLNEALKVKKKCHGLKS